MPLAKLQCIAALSLFVIFFDQFAMGGVMEDVSSCFRQKYTPRKKKRERVVTEFNHTHLNPFITMNPVVDDKGEKT